MLNTTYVDGDYPDIFLDFLVLAVNGLDNKKLLARDCKYRCLYLDIYRFEPGVKVNGY